MRALPKKSATRWLGAAAPALVAWSLTSGMAQAATPAAGTIISNQAAASYTDGQGVDRVSQSNAVETLVLPKAAFSLASDNTKQASPGSTVYFTHTLTNTGNAADTFKITVDKPANTVGSPASTCDIYIDEDGNGLPDSNTPIGACGTPFTTTSVLAGGLYRFVIGATVNGQASTGDEATIAVHAKSVTDPAATGAPEQNTDTLQIANGAAFNVNKSSNKSSGPTGSVITYTFTIANTGNAAGDLTITDALGNGPTAGLRYVSGSGTWSNGQGALTDASDGAEKSDGNGGSIDYQAPTEASKPGDVVVKLTGFNPGATQTVTFQAKVADTATVGKDMTTNAADYTCQIGDGGKDCRTNEVIFEVLRAMSVVANGSTSSSVNGSNEPLTVTEATAGSTVHWTDVIWNTGNDTETYQLTLSKENFPAGTTFMLFQADGATPLVQGLTPPIPASGSAGVCAAPLVKDAETNACGYPVVVQAQLPMNASGDGPFQASYIAASTSDPSQTDSVENQLAKLSSAAFVLANDISAALRGTATPQTTLTATIGGSVTFPLYVKSNSVDTFALSYSGTDFNAGIVPAGWRVEFRSPTAGTCDAPGAQIMNARVTETADPSDTTTPDATLIACAVVSAPEDAAQSTQKVYFKATGTSGVSSAKLDAVTISANRLISLVPNQTQQVAPGGSVTYSHVLTNQGNQAEGGTCSAMSFSGDNSLAGDGWTSVVYYDANNNGELDPSDPVVESLAQITASGKYTDGTAAVAGTLPSGKGLRLFVKVFAPSSAAAGETDNRTLQAIVKNSTGAGACASPEPAAQSVVDTSNVMTAQIRLLKEQGLDAKCDGVVDLAFSATQIQVKPGECVIYRVQASNQGVDAVTNVIMNDSVPAFSTYVDIKDSSICTPGQATTPANGGTGSVTCNVGELKPGAKATMQFNVKLDD